MNLITQGKLMKLNLLIFIILITYSFSIHANPKFVENTGLHYDDNGNLIMPDKFYLRLALKSYQDGYNLSAYTNFKKAAAFGNSVAQKYLGLMYLKALGVERDWAIGYAWIKLSATDRSAENRSLENKIFKLLKPEEVQQSELIYQQIKQDYDQIAALKRRDNWVRKQSNKIIGSHVGGQTSNVYSYNPNGRLISANSTKGFEQMKSFVEDFNYGYVTGGEIVPLDETQTENNKE
jgi:hypothetical protein